MTLHEDFIFLIDKLPIELLNTIYMVIVSTLFAILIGFPLGVILVLTDKRGIKPHLSIYRGLSLLVDIGRSVPFAILMIAIIPFTRFIVGSSIGTTASIVPLTIAAAPFFARLVESSLKEIRAEVIETALLMGSSVKDIIFKVFIPETFPQLIQSVTMTMINLIGYSAMAGLVGGGGLGKIAIQYGYHRFNGTIMLVTLIILIILVQIVQKIGNRLSLSILKKRGL